MRRSARASAGPGDRGEVVVAAGAGRRRRRTRASVADLEGVAAVGQVDPAGGLEARRAGPRHGSCGRAECCAGRRPAAGSATGFLSDRREVVVGPEDEDAGDVEQVAVRRRARPAPRSRCARLSPVLTTRSGSRAGQPAHPVAACGAGSGSGAGRRRAAPAAARGPAAGPAREAGAARTSATRRPRSPARRRRPTRPPASAVPRPRAARTRGRRHGARLSHGASA